MHVLAALVLGQALRRSYQATATLPNRSVVTVGWNWSLGRLSFTSSPLAAV